MRPPTTFPGRTALGILLCLLPWLAAAGTLDEIRARGMLRVCVKNEGPADIAEHNDPAHFRKRGFELELAGLLAGRILGDETKLDIQLYKRPRRLPALIEGKVDMGISMFSVDEDDTGQVVFSEPYYEDGLAVMHPAATTLNGMADLAGKTVIALEEHSSDPGAALQKAAAAQSVQVNIRHVSTFQEGVDLLSAGGTEGMVAMHANLDTFIAHGHPEFAVSPLLTHERFGVAVRKGDDELLTLVNEVIAGLKASGQLQALQAKWELIAP